MALTRGVRALAALCLVTRLFVCYSTNETNLLTLEFEHERTSRVHDYNVTTPRSVFVEVRPCGGEFNWNFTSPSGITLASGGYRGPQIETSGTLTGHHTETYDNRDTPPGTYHLQIETGRGIKGIVYFQIYIWSSQRNLNRPRLPVDDRLKALMATTDKVSLSWEPSPTENVEYCVYYLKKTDTKDFAVHSSICSTQFTQEGIEKQCTVHTEINVTGLAAGTLYIFNMVVSLPNSHIRSAYEGVQFGTLSDSDLTGQWPVVGKMATEILTDNVLTNSYVRQKYLREFNFAVERSTNSVEFLIRACDSFFQWQVIAPNATVLEQGSFKENETGSSKTFEIQSPTSGIYKIVIRGGQYTHPDKKNISLQLLARPIGIYHPQLPQNKTLRLVVKNSSFVTLKWNPSPTVNVTYCVIYHVTNSDDCMSQNSNPCVQIVKVAQANINLDSLSATTYVDVVIYEPKWPQYRSMYTGVLVNKAEFTQQPPVTDDVHVGVSSGRLLFISISLVTTMLCVYFLL